MAEGATRITVLMYHRVGDVQNAWERRYGITPQDFRAHMHKLQGIGMQAVSLGAFLAWLSGARELPEGSFLITFDDGYLGVHDYAAPVLEELGWPAVVFLVSQRLGTTDLWCQEENPDRRALPLMDRTQIESLCSRGFEFHSHTRTHPDLTCLDGDALTNELKGSREDLEDLLGRRINCLAYPYGRFDERVAEAAAAAGYTHAFSTQPGFNRRQADPYRIRRLDIAGTDTPQMLVRKIRLGSNNGSLQQSLRYYAGRLLGKLGLS